MSDTIYRIQICQNQTRFNCTCSNACERGFFSVWLSVLYGIVYAQSRGWQFYIDMNDKSYAYSQPDDFGGNCNFLEYYFHQPLSKTQADVQPGIVCRIKETYPHRIWHSAHLHQLHKAQIKYLPFRENIAEWLAEKTQIFAQKRVLGIHLRGTDHADEVPPVSWTVWKKILLREKDNYEKIFVATDDVRMLQRVTDLIGTEQLLVNDVIRSSDGLPLHINHPALGGHQYQLGLEALLDCYSLSRCQHALLCESNLSYAALVFNPNLNYQLLTAWSHTKLGTIVGTLRRAYYTYRLLWRWQRIKGKQST